MVRGRCCICRSIFIRVFFFKKRLWWLVYCKEILWEVEYRMIFVIERFCWSIFRSEI